VYALSIPGGNDLMDGDDGMVTAVASRSIEASDWLLVVTKDASSLHRQGSDNALGLVQRIGGVAVVAVLVAVVLFLARQRRLLRRAVAAEQDRAVATERYDQLLAHARDVVLLTDESGQIIDANETAVASYGYDATTLRSMRIEDLRAPEEQWSVARDLEAARAPGGATFETVHRRKDGGRVPVEVSTHAVAVRGGTHFESVVRDMSDRKEAEQAIRRQLDELRRWQAGTIGREERILALKAEVNDLLEAADRPPKYGSVLEGAPDHAG
jgi:PAS domain S-box-containing protein